MKYVHGTELDQSPKNAGSDLIHNALVSYLKFLFLTFNILLESEINMSFCTD